MSSPGFSSPSQRKPDAAVSLGLETGIVLAWYSPILPASSTEYITEFHGSDYSTPHSSMLKSSVPPQSLSLEDLNSCLLVYTADIS